MPHDRPTIAPPMPYRELAEVAAEGARRGAQALLRSFRSGDLDVRRKGPHDLVTRADHESEAAVVELLRERFPDHHVLAEERGFEAGGRSAYEWLVDPLDGTNNFLQGLPYFCISIACLHHGRPAAAVVLDPLGDNLFSATRGGGATWNGRPIEVSKRGGLAGAFLATGYPFRARAALDLYLEVFRTVFLEARAIRRCGAAALDLAFTAAGVYDGFFEFRLSPWDIAAGILLVEEAGGRATDLDGGDSYFSGGNVIAGGHRVQSQLLELVRSRVDEAGMEDVDPVGNRRAPATVR